MGPWESHGIAWLLRMGRDHPREHIPDSTRGGMGEEPESSSSPVRGISASGDSDDDEASPFVSNEGTEKHRVSSYEKDLLLFARQRASMDDVITFVSAGRIQARQ